LADPTGIAHRSQIGGQSVNHFHAGADLRSISLDYLRDLCPGKHRYFGDRQLVEFGPRPYQQIFDDVPQVKSLFGDCSKHLLSLCRRHLGVVVAKQLSETRDSGKGRAQLVAD